MTILSAQSIRRLCALPSQLPRLVMPFAERGVVNGKSYGLSACTYDCRIDQDLVLQPMPFEVIASFIARADVINWSDAARLVPMVSGFRHRALASTIERFSLPNDVCGSVLDKSSYARVFVSAFNTHLDPGWDGYLTVELANLGDTEVTYRRGDPVCQIKFEWLDQPTDLPYRGRKYSDQKAGPQPAILEEAAE